MNPSFKILRNRKSDTAEFRAAAVKVCMSLMRKAKALLKKRRVSPQRVMFIIILRSGIALLAPALRIFPEAKVGVLGMKRDERTFTPRSYYENLPSISKGDTVVILDPMLATGGSAEAAVKRLIARGADAKRIYFVGVIAAPEGITRLTRRIQKENVIVASIDERLDAHAMIVPGLGDFGDRYFGY